MKILTTILFYINARFHLFLLVGTFLRHTHFDILNWVCANYSKMDSTLSSSLILSFLILIMSFFPWVSSNISFFQFSFFLPFTFDRSGVRQFNTLLLLNIPVEGTITAMGINRKECNIFLLNLITKLLSHTYLFIGFVYLERAEIFLQNTSRIYIRNVYLLNTLT